MLSLSLIMPAYNEEKRIRNTLIEYANFLDSKKIDYEILVVLNGCKDNTLGVVSEIAKVNKKIKFIDIKKAIGKGGAIVEGFKIANKELIGFVDADNATKADAFYDLIKKIDSFDGVIASRWIKGAKVNIKQPLMKRVGSRGFNFLVKVLFGLNYIDTQCGAKLFKKETIKKVLPSIGLTRWAFDIDLLYQMKRNKFKVVEIPTVWDAAEASHFGLMKAAPDMFLAIIRLRLVYSPFKFIVRIYNRLPEFLKIHHYMLK